MSRFNPFLAAAAVAFGLLVAGSASPAWAQKGGHGGGGGGGHAAASSAHASSSGNWHGGSNGNWHGGNNWHGNEFHNNRYFFGVGFAPWWYSYYPWYAYYPGYAYAPTYYADYSSFYPSAAVAPPAAPPVAQGDPNIARVGVLLPDPSAQVLIDGKPTTTTGTARLFETPGLEPGKTYSYQVSASWMDNGKPVKLDQKIKVTPGKLTVVDFNRSAMPAPQANPG